MPVRVAGLRGRRVPELPLYPADVRPGLEEQGGVAEPRRVGLPVRKLRGREQGAPDELRERAGARELQPSPTEVTIRLIGHVIILSLILAPLAAGAQHAAKAARIGYLSINLAAAPPNQLEALRRGLRDLGYVEGRDVVIEYRDALSHEEARRVFATAESLKTQEQLDIKVIPPQR
jgi:hypothetical protein